MTKAITTNIVGALLPEKAVEIIKPKKKRRQKRTMEYRIGKNKTQMAYMRKRRDIFFAKHNKCIDCKTSDRDKLQVKFIGEKDPRYEHRVWSLTNEKLMVELEKAVAICRSCSAIRNAANKIKHGSISRYKKAKCRCNICVLRYKLDLARRSRHGGKAVYRQLSEVMVEFGLDPTKELKDQDVTNTLKHFKII